jgi:hypothetical protein
MPGLERCMPGTIFLSKRFGIFVTFNLVKQNLDPDSPKSLDPNTDPILSTTQQSTGSHLKTKIFRSPSRPQSAVFYLHKNKDTPQDSI